MASTATIALCTLTATWQSLYFLLDNFTCYSTISNFLGVRESIVIGSNLSRRDTNNQRHLVTTVGIMSSGGSSSAPTAKLQPTKSNEPDPAQASKPVEKAPALLEEDDEFEDFPVEGMYWIVPP